MLRQAEDVVGRTEEQDELMQLYDIIIRFLRDNMHPTLVNFAT